MKGDLEARRERFKQTLTALDPKEMEQWGARPFTPEQLAVKGKAARELPLNGDGGRV